MKLYSLLALVAAALSTAAFAERTDLRSSTSRSASDYSTEVHNRSVGVGMQVSAFPDGTSINQIHALFEIAPRMLIGGGFGFAHDFDYALVSADLRYNLVKHGAASVYMDGEAGWQKRGASSTTVVYVDGVPTAGGSSANGLMLAFLLGVNYAVTDNLQLNAGYGIQMAFGSAANGNFGFTNNSPLGNFGIHWYF